MQFPKKVKYHLGAFRLTLLAGTLLLLIACGAFAEAFIMRSAHKPEGWSVLAAIGGFCALGMAGLTFVVRLAEWYARHLRDKEENDARNAS